MGFRHLFLKIVAPFGGFSHLSGITACSVEGPGTEGSRYLGTKLETEYITNSCPIPTPFGLKSQQGNLFPGTFPILLLCKALSVHMTINDNMVILKNRARGRRPGKSHLPCLQKCSRFSLASALLRGCIGVGVSVQIFPNARR